jgi:ankyrin repeat protein
LLIAAGAAWASDADELVQKVWAGDLEGISQLLDAGAEVDARNKDGSTALVLAASFRGYEDVVELLVSRGADVNATAGNGMTPLMAAATVSKTGAELLLSKGADVRARSADGATALLRCLMGNLEGQDRLDVAELLLAGGAEVNDALPGGTTVLMIAAGTGELEMVRLLVSKGADVGAVRERDGKTALDLATEKGHAQVVEFLKAKTKGQLATEEGSR